MTITLEQLLALEGQPSKAFAQASELIRQIPPKPDTADRLAKLEQQIRKDEQQSFGELWEAYFAALD